MPKIPTNNDANVTVAALIDPRLDKALVKIVSVKGGNKSDHIRAAILEYVKNFDARLLPKDLPSDDELTEDQVAERVNIPLGRFREIRKNGLGPKCRWYHGRYLYKPEDVEEWLKT